MQTATAFAFWIAIFATSTEAQPTSIPPKRVELCAVLQKPSIYLNKRIAIDADVLADGMHGSVLISPKCDHGIVPDFSLAAAAGHRYGNAIFTGHPGTIDKDIHAHFVGVLRREPSTGMFRHGHLIYVLHVQAMDHLTIQFKPGQAPPEPPPIITNMPPMHPTHP